jgi:hypothetical protein
MMEEDTDLSLFRNKVAEMSKTLDTILEKKETGKHIELSINDATNVFEKLG